MSASTKQHKVYQKSRFKSQTAVARESQNVALDLL